MDIETGRTTPMQCSILTLVFSTILAGLLIAVPAVASAASYVNESLGSQLALVVADTKAKGVPSFVSVGMFRVCYKSPGTTCLALSLGLTIDPVGFEGADKWAKALPPLILTQVWPILAVSACAITIVAAFTFCKGMPQLFRWIVLIATVAIDIAYFVVTAVMFFTLKKGIEENTKYTPHPVTLTVIFYVAPVVVLIFIPLIRIFIPSNEEITTIPQPIMVAITANAVAMNHIINMLHLVVRNGQKKDVVVVNKDGEKGDSQEDAKGVDQDLLNRFGNQARAMLAQANGMKLPGGALDLLGGKGSMKPKRPERPNPFVVLDKLVEEARYVKERRTKLRQNGSNEIDTGENSVTERTVAKQIRRIEELAMVNPGGSKGYKATLHKRKKGQLALQDDAKQRVNGVTTVEAASEAAAKKANAAGVSTAVVGMSERERDRALALGIQARPAPTAPPARPQVPPPPPKTKPKGKGKVAFAETTQNKAPVRPMPGLASDAAQSVPAPSAPNPFTEISIPNCVPTGREVAHTRAIPAALRPRSQVAIVRKPLAVPARVGTTPLPPVPPVPVQAGSTPSSMPGPLQALARLPGSSTAKASPPQKLAAGTKDKDKKDKHESVAIKWA